MKKYILSALCIVLAIPSLVAQTPSEIDAARRIANQYGYTSGEIDNILGGRMAQTAQQQPLAIEEEAQPVRVVQAVPEAQTSRTDGSGIYGHDFFNSSGFGIIPSYNAPVPESFVLGPGDEIVIDIYGSSTNSMSSVIGKDGKVNLPDVGPVSLAGLTVAKAETALKSRLSKVYGGLANGQTKLQLTIGKVKGVTVNVLGEVKVPGVYNLPSLASVCSAVFMAGGVTSNASVRNINLYRGGRLVGTFDLYDFIFHGTYGNNLRLQENDIVQVASNSLVVSVSGSVNRPMRYEMKADESVAELIEYAGGFNASANRNRVHVDRNATVEGTSFDIDKSQFGTFRLMDADSISISSSVARMDNRVTVSGPVVYAGSYSISESLKTVSDLVKAAGGLREEAYTVSAFIRRLGADRQFEMVPVNLTDAMAGIRDITLMRDDELVIASVNELIPEKQVSIFGQVNAPGTFVYGKGMTVGSLLLMAGGLMDGAVLENVEISRRNLDGPELIFSIDLTDNKAYDTVLQPYDKVYVSRHLHFREQPSVTITGEVACPGTYPIEFASARLSDVIKRAGGCTSNAYVEGTRLSRVMTPSERERQASTMDITTRRMETTTDTISLEQLSAWEKYFVAVDLKKALSRPGSVDDIELRDGDIIEIPVKNNTVKISGAVLHPNTVAYSDKFSLNDYVSMAGGYSKAARRSKVYIVYTNGSAAARGSRLFHFEPGMEIVVPQKEQKPGREITPAEVTSMASSTSSLAYMISALVKLFH